MPGIFRTLSNIIWPNDHVHVLSSGTSFLSLSSPHLISPNKQSGDGDSGTLSRKFKTQEQHNTTRTLEWKVCVPCGIDGIFGAAIWRLEMSTTLNDKTFQEMH